MIQSEQLATCVVASTRSAKTLADAQALGLIQQGYSNPVEAVQDADLVVLALPVRATHAVLAQIQPYLHPDVILTDVGSTKGNVVEAAKAVLVRHFLPDLYQAIQLLEANIPVCMQARWICLPTIK